MSSKKIRIGKKQANNDVQLMSSLGLTKSAQENLKLDSAQIENLKQFKTANGKHYTGLLNDDRPIVDLFRPEEPLQTYSPSNYTALSQKRLLKATVNGRLYPDFIDMSPACGNITNQGIGSCYMHANVNFAKWFVWMRTGKKYSPSNSTIDNVYAQGVTGGLAYDIEGFRNDLCLVELVPLSMLDEEASKTGKDLCGGKAWVRCILVPQRPASEQPPEPMTLASSKHFLNLQVAVAPGI